MTGQPLDPGYECVETELGRDLPLLADPDLDQAYRQKLLAHVAVCDDCRIRLDLESRVAVFLKSSESNHGPQAGSSGRRPRAVLLGWVGGAALAAGLGLLLILPPQARDSGFRYRSGEKEPFLSPVEGELVSGTEPTIKWQSVKGATSYKIVVNEIGGKGRWEGETSDTRWTVQDEESLPLGKEFRAILHTVPVDLTPPSGFTVAFRTGPWTEFIGQRVRRGNKVAQVVGLLGAVVSVFAWGRIALKL